MLTKLCMRAVKTPSSAAEHDVLQHLNGLRRAVSLVADCMIFCNEEQQALYSVKYSIVITYNRTLQ